VPRHDECDVERLTEFNAPTVADLNRLIPQLKPDWTQLTAAQLEALIASESRVYVARHDGRIVGLTVMVPHRHLPGLRYHIEDVVVAHEYRGAGLGRRLLEFAMGDVPGPVISFDLPSPATREHAHRLYTSLGYRPSDTTVFRLEAAPRP
jgi:GNAT superfamily N-acetyltransferase